MLSKISNENFRWTVRIEVLLFKGKGLTRKFILRFYTRITLPSTSGARTPKAIDAIARAVWIKHVNEKLSKVHGSKLVSIRTTHPCLTDGKMVNFSCENWIKQGTHHARNSTSFYCLPMTSCMIDFMDCLRKHGASAHLQYSLQFREYFWARKQCAGKHTSNRRPPSWHLREGTWRADSSQVQPKPDSLPMR